MASYLAYRVIERISRILPVRAGYRAAKASAEIGWQFCPAIRAHVCSNLAHLLGGSPKQYREASKEIFCHFGYYLFEVFTMHRLDLSSIAVEGMDHLNAARQANRGVILLTAHLGNWELGAKVFQSLGYALSVVALPHGDSRMDSLFNAQRIRAGANIIPVDRHATRSSLNALRKGRLLALLADRDFIGDGIPVSMGESKMLIPKGPAVLSLRAQAPIVPAFLVREAEGRFKLICKEVLWPTLDKSAKRPIEALVAAYAKVLEDALKCYSRQWLMFQPVFQTS